MELGIGRVARSPGARVPVRRASAGAQGNRAERPRRIPPGRQVAGSRRGREFDVADAGRPSPGI